MKTFRQAALVIFIFALTALTLSVYAQNSPTPEEDLIYVNAVAWSHDGSKIAAAGIRQPATQGYLRVIDVQTGQTLYALDPSPGGFTSVAWSPDDRFIAAGGYDQVIWVFDVVANSHVATLWGHQSTVTAVDWNADGTRLVSSGNWDELIILWDTATHEQIRVIEVRNPLSVAFSPDSQRIAVGGAGGLRIFPSTLDVGSGRQQEPYRHFTTLNVGALAWSHDSSRIAFGTQTFPSVVNPNRRAFAQLYVVDGNSGFQLSNFPTEDETIYGLAWSPDDRLIATHSIDGFVRIWDVATSMQLENFPGMTRYPVDISFSPYGGRLAYGGSIPADAVASATAQIEGVDAVQALANRGVQIVVPAPSLERLQAIAQACNAPASLTAALPTALPTDAALLSETTQAAALAAFVAQVEALPADAIPPACAADLIAVAEALLSGA
jgi:dipeptidyl aminopeptidase/acylaminoacyl peptidase